jgi:hypothetical protein
MNTTAERRMKINNNEYDNKKYKAAEIGFAIYFFHLISA